MGEIAEMMLEGDLCEGCGMALGGEGYGIPRYCSNECAKDRGFDGIQSDGAGTYKKQPKENKHKGERPHDVISIKITYNGDKIYYATKADSSFAEASDIARTLNNFLGVTETFGIQPRYVHPKANITPSPQPKEAPLNKKEEV